MWRHAHEDEGAKAHSLAIVNVSTKLSKYVTGLSLIALVSWRSICAQSDPLCHSLVLLFTDNVLIVQKWSKYS